YNANLQGNLKKGDTLFFKVLSLEPSLVLKIHSVSSSIGGKEIAAEELLRMLDLPEAPIYFDILNFLKSHKSTVVRDDTLIYYKIYASVKENVKKSKSPDELFQAVLTLEEYNLPPGTKLFNKLLPVFDGADNIMKALKLLENNIDKLPPIIADQLKKVFGRLLREKTGTNFTSGFFSFKSSKDSDIRQLSSILIDLLAYDDDKAFSASHSEIKEAAKDILDTLEAKEVWNAFAIQNQQPLQLILPFVISGRIHICQLALQRHVEKNNEDESTLMFSFDTLTKRLGVVSAFGSAISEKLSLSMSAETEEAAKILSVHIEELKKSLQAEGFTIVSLKVASRERTEEEIHAVQQGAHTQQQGFRVVV
ncbi:MAG: hypothetical protein QG635_1116, partial [Bacteroidota bacterium]|nr:hypothetical protein [Bacteroidota bacterium]